MALTGLTNPNRRVKVHYNDGRREPRTMCIRAVLMDVQVWDTADHLTSDFAFEAVLPINAGPHRGSSYLTHFNDSKGAIIGPNKKRITEGPVVNLVHKLRGDYAAPWLYRYMLEELDYTEGTVNSMMKSFDPRVRALCSDSVWDKATWTVSCPLLRTEPSSFAQLSSRLRARGLEDGALDLSQLLADKKSIDTAADAEELKAREEMINRDRLYAKPTDKRVGASGASVRTETGADEISAAASAAKSTATENLRQNYTRQKLDNANMKGDLAALRSALQAQGLDPDIILNAQKAQDESDELSAVSGISVEKGTTEDADVDADNTGDARMAEAAGTASSGRATSSEVAGQGTHEEK